MWTRISSSFIAKCIQKYIEILFKFTILDQIDAEADPGLVVGGASPLGAPTQYIYTFSEILHEIKEIWVRGGGVGVQEHRLP